MSYFIYGKWQMTLYGSNVNVGEGIQTKAALLAEPTMKVSGFEIYAMKPTMISEGEQTEYLNKYKTSISSFRYGGVFKLRGMHLDGTDQTYDEYFSNTATGSLPDVMTQKYHWLGIPTDYPVIPVAGFVKADQAMAIALGEMNTEEKANVTFYTIDWSQRKLNGDLT